MLKLSNEQYAYIEKMEDDSFVRDTVRKLKQQFPAITEPDEHLNARMKIALEYANVFSLKEKMQNITS
ncbi:TPA: hypothetical protein ACOXIQ_003747 [Salmonella enterica]|nr:hypothetical protein [Salmonella enterica subsp. enterica serovar Kinondoni]ELS9673521.1 hypothetical protein [Salmonella enterica]EIC0166016.1 hypothetical protein [Salmonella enterica subsp. enterica serovar Kinondoni]ELY6075991.1 hypothetical protein [Salmonella enterica]MKU02906.1 hypothetical protein [Salmonella enterica subsp. enterica serovar Kinondoni]